MINTQRVKLMTEMQIFVDHEGDETRPMAEYYRSDYVAKQLLLSVLSGSAIFLLLCLLVFTEDVEALLLTIDLENLTASLSPLMFRYVVFMIAYLALTFLVYGVRYGRGRKRIKSYYAKLSALEKQYKEEEKQHRPTGGME